MVVVVLWLVTSAYAIELGTYPNEAVCVHVGSMVDAQLKRPPRAVLANVFCLQTLKFPGARAMPPSEPRLGPNA